MRDIPAKDLPLVQSGSNVDPVRGKRAIIVPLQRISIHRDSEVSGHAGVPGLTCSASSVVTPRTTPLVTFVGPEVCWASVVLLGDLAAAGPGNAALTYKAWAFLHD